MPFVDEVQKLFEGFEKRPPTEQTDTFIGQDFSIALTIPLFQVEHIFLIISQRFFVIVLVKGYGSAINFFPEKFKTTTKIIPPLFHFQAFAFCSSSKST